jgi:hypothetical protein
VETLFKQIQDCADYAGGVLIGHPQQINVGFAKIFTTGHFMSACRHLNKTSQPLTVITSKCRANPLPQPDTIQQTPP